MKLLGIDPDTHRVGFAYGDKTAIRAVHCTRLDPKQTGRKAIIALAKEIDNVFLEIKHGLIEDDPEAIIVEGQKAYIAGKAKPDHIIRLAQACGVILGGAARAFPNATLVFPDPQQWKGSVPKMIHQKRTLSLYGWEPQATSRSVFPVAIPNELVQMVEIPVMAWSHIIDAMGLVYWAAARAEKGLRL